MSRRVRNSAAAAEEAHPAGARASAADASTASWNATFLGFSADDRARLLALSLPGGILFAQQLPDSKLNRKTDERPGGPFAPFVTDQAKTLKPTVLNNPSCFDQDLDRWQKEAVAKALSTPDIFLLRGRPGSGKSRVVTEIIRQILQRGQRVLFLAKQAAAIDRALQSLPAESAGSAIRCLNPGEDPGQLEPAKKALLLDKRVADLTGQARRAAQSQLAEAVQEGQKLDQAIVTVPQLQAVRKEVDTLAQTRQLLESRRTRIDEDLVARSRSSKPDSFGLRLQEIDEASSRQAEEAGRSQAEFERQATSTRSEQAKLEAELDALKPLCQDWAAQRFWTPGWWKALVGAEQRHRAGELTDQIAQLSTRLLAEEGQIASTHVARQQAVERARAERDEVFSAERRRSEQQILAELAAVDTRYSELAILVNDLQAKVNGHAGKVGGMPGDPEQALSVLRSQKDAAQIQVEKAERWLKLLDQHPRILRDALIEHCPIVAGTAAGWLADSSLTPKMGGQLFDFLILEESDQFTEVECAGFARLARHWILVGSDYQMTSGSSPVDSTGSAPSTITAHSSLLFAQIWDALHSIPHKLPYAWIQEENQLVCRLRPVAPEQRTWIEIERLADHPQIVLHILALPRSRPVVAEVVFPATFGVEKAKQFILQELEELAIHAPTGTMRWHDGHADRLVLQFAGHSCQHDRAIELISGVRELVHSCPLPAAGTKGPIAWRTCCIEFDYKSGWQRAAAEDWIAQHLGLRDLGRTSQLDSIHRHSDGVSKFVHQLLDPHAREMDGDVDKALSEAIEFVAVPAQDDALRGERNAAPGRVRSAGLELDLTDLRSKDRLPMALRGGLPNQGFINLAEAQAIVRRLESMERNRIQRPDRAPPISLFVIALYEAQAELIRKLVKNSPTLAPVESRIEVGVSEDFAHREAGLVLLSLTRSHTHRATTFGSSTKDLLIALTRARDHLVIFGDYGALQRRSLWDGAVERSDAAQAAQERLLIKTLLAHPRISVSRRAAAVGAEGQAI
ncbi:hypothetical protein BH10PLA2_BH10PLA2_08400 [soil metagenome]